MYASLGVGWDPWGWGAVEWHRCRTTKGYVKNLHMVRRWHPTTDYKPCDYTHAILQLQNIQKEDVSGRCITKPNHLPPPPPLYKLRPCPSYSRRRDRVNLVPNFNSVPNVVQPRGVWGVARVFDGKLYFIRDHMQGNFIPKDLKLPQPKPAPKPPAKTSSKASSSDEHVQLFRMVYDPKNAFQAEHL